MASCSSDDDTNATPTKDKDKTFTVVFDLNGGTGDAPPDQTIKKDNKATKPVNPTRDGYTFDGWYEKQDGNGTAFTFGTTPITADITLYAGWTPVYTVTFDLNYEKAIDTPPVAQTIKKGDKATAPTDPTRDNYTFDNWYTDTATTKVFAFTTVITGDMTLYAGWTAIITYTVTFDGNYDGAAAATTVTVEHGKKAADPTIDDYDFEGWYEKQDGSGNKFAFDTTPITKDTTLYAKWICPVRKARETLTHEVALYNEGEADAPYVPEKLLGTFASDAFPQTFYVLIPQIPKNVSAEKANQLPYISPFSHLPSFETIDTIAFRSGGFEITPDYIDASFQHPTLSGDSTVRISCYSTKQVNDSLYFYYGKVRFLYGGQETEAYNKSMYAWTGIDKNNPANKDALYGYMVSKQGSYLRALYIYPFVGGIYTRASDGKTVTFPKTEADYAALTLEDLQIIATAPLTSNLLFAKAPGAHDYGIYGIDD